MILYLHMSHSNFNFKLDVELIVCIFRFYTLNIHLFFSTCVYMFACEGSEGKLLSFYMGSGICA